MREPLRLRRFLFAGAAVVLGLSAALALVEIGLRVFSLAPSAGISTATEAEYQRIPGLFAPGQRIVDRQIPVLAYRVTIDSLGYRGAEFPVAKPRGALRVLSVGDSFTYGDYVDDSSTVPAVLERELAARCAQPVTVINAGVGGSTINTQLHMVERGWSMAPDVVVLTFSENDVSDLRSDTWQELADNRRAKSRFPLSVVYPVLRRMALWHFALRVRAQARIWSREGEVVATPSTPVVDSDVGELRARYTRLLRELVADVRAHGRGFLLVAFPSHLTVSGAKSDEQLKWLESVAAELGIPMVNLLPTLRATGLPMESLYLLPHDGHASPRGNALAGAAVAAKLADLGLCGT